jgi:hypothetical protein
MSNETENKPWDSETEIDWDSDVSDAPPPPLAPGLYGAKVVKADYRVANSGNLCINLEMAIVRHFQGDDLPAPKKTFKTLTFTKGSAFMAKGAARAAGCYDALPKKVSEETLRAFADRLLGADVIVKTRNAPHRTDKTRTNIEVDRFCTLEQAEVIKAGGNPDAKPAEGAAAPAAGGADGNGGRRRRGQQAA